MELPNALEQLAPGRAREPLGGEDQRDVIAGLGRPGEVFQGLVRGRRADDLVASSVAVEQLPFDVAQGDRFVVDG
jgi:hypothetical protein